MKFESAIQDSWIYGHVSTAFVAHVARCGQIFDPRGLQRILSDLIRFRMLVASCCFVICAWDQWPYFSWFDHLWHFVAFDSLYRSGQLDFSQSYSRSKCSCSGVDHFYLEVSVLFFGREVFLFFCSAVLLRLISKKCIDCNFAISFRCPKKRKKPSSICLLAFFGRFFCERLDNIFCNP